MNDRDIFFQVKLEPSSCTDEKHALYSKYQQQVHHDQPSKCKVGNFTNFLVDSPLTVRFWTTELAVFHQGGGSSKISF